VSISSQFILFINKLDGYATQALKLKKIIRDSGLGFCILFDNFHFHNSRVKGLYTMEYSLLIYNWHAVAKTMIPPLFDKQEVGIWRVQKRFPRYGVPVWRLWPNIRFLPSIVAEKNVTKKIFTFIIPELRDFIPWNIVCWYITDMLLQKLIV
jgi:hypothetical protein